MILLENSVQSYSAFFGKIVCISTWRLQTGILNVALLENKDIHYSHLILYFVTDFLYIISNQTIIHI